MFAKKTLVLVTTALFGLALGVGCKGVENLESDPAAQALSQPEAMRVDLNQSGSTSTNTTQASPVRPKPSQVSCEGDQNHGGRICCDSTHCCINILGVINCKLPPRKQ
jgi:hypothetical protein